MDSNKSQQEEVYFPDEDIFDKVSEILLKHGIKESSVDAAFKKDKKSFISVVLNLTKNIVKEKISENDFCLSLQTQLKISKSESESMLKDVKEKIIPLAEKVQIGQNLEERPIENPITAKPIRLINEVKRSDTSMPIMREKPKKRMEEIIEKEKIYPRKEQQKISPKKQDTYREPIE